MKTPRVKPVREIHTHAPIQSYLLPFFVAYSLLEEKAVMKGCKYVNKKPKLIPQI
jgi:hypothetical protein